MGGCYSFLFPPPKELEASRRLAIYKSEKPEGITMINGTKVWVYTKEQQERLAVNQFGNFIGRFPFKETKTKDDDDDSGLELEPLPVTSQVLISHTTLGTHWRCRAPGGMEIGQKVLVADFHGSHEKNALVMVPAQPPGRAVLGGKDFTVFIPRDF